MNNVQKLIAGICQGYYMSLVKKDYELSSSEETEYSFLLEVWDKMDAFEEAGFFPGPDYDNRNW